MGYDKNDTKIYANLKEKFRLSLIKNLRFSIKIATNLTKFIKIICFIYTAQGLTLASLLKYYVRGV